MPNTFDEASAATEAMFTEKGQTPPDAPGANEENPPQEDTQQADANAPTEAENEQQADGSGNAAAAMVADATQTAEAAAQAASERETQLQQAAQEIELLKQQNQQLQGTIDEMSRQNTENIIKTAIEPPTIDLNALTFADEAEQQAALAKYAEELSAYNRKQLMEEMTPALEYAKEGMREKEKAEAIEALSQIPELSGIKDMKPQLDKIIANNKWLSSDDMPVDEKYINAYAMALGVNSMNTPPAPPTKEPTTEELMELYNSNPAFQEMVEKQRLEQIKQSQQVPQFSASSGAVNAALNIKEKPQTLEEASKRTREMFGDM